MLIDNPIFNQLSALNLPINRHLGSIVAFLAHNQNLILQAEPGAGKTSVVPLALLSLIPPNKKILLLQPRRLAARHAASRMADILEEPIAKTVGYRIKNESNTSSTTKIEVITEGILIRMMQSDPELDAVAMIIFDEFHERSINADLGLALALEIQQNLRDDLKLVIMSATLNIEKISQLLIDAPIVNVAGRCFPVNLNYQPAKTNQDWPQAMLLALNQGIITSENDILVFLPGIGEINKAFQLLKTKFESDPLFIVTPLYGELPIEQQLLAMKPVKFKRKVILATNIAETSLTIEGVDCVIDSGLVRQSEFDPNVGFDRLITRRISLASATQRAGRAGRMRAGCCYRLWPESENLRAETVPEILRTDLASFTLELAKWGIKDTSEIGLIDQPNGGAYQQAINLLIGLGALSKAWQITEHGIALLSTGVYPRIAHMLLQSISLGGLELACLIAVMLQEKDVFKGEQRFDVDFFDRIQFLVNQSGDKKLIGYGANHSIFKQVSLLKRNLKKQINFDWSRQNKIDDCLILAPTLLAMVFPDRIAKKRGNGYLLSNGSGAQLNSDISINSEFLVVTKLGGTAQSAKIYQAIAITKAEIDQLFSQQYTNEERVYWDNQSLSVKAERQTKLAELVLSVQTITSIPPSMLLNSLMSGIQKQGISQLPWTKQLRQWQARVQMLHLLNSEQYQFPDVSDAYLLASINEWLLPYLNGISQWTQITDKLLSTALTNSLNWTLQNQLDQLMPVSLVLASGSKVTIDYCQGDKPVLEVKLQEMFGEVTNPSIANGMIPLVLHLLSPAKRPLQITEDLASFWNNAYIDVKKEMKGRYPKHPWPDDPLTAQPTKFTNQRK